MPGGVWAGLTSVAMGIRCENCDRDDDDVVGVHRLYVVPEDWDTAGSVTKVDQVERWCFSCRSLYPHEVAEG